MFCRTLISLGRDAQLEHEDGGQESAISGLVSVRQSNDGMELTLTVVAYVGRRKSDAQAQAHAVGGRRTPNSAPFNSLLYGAHRDWNPPSKVLKFD